jgi:hypothetical protein
LQSNNFHEKYEKVAIQAHEAGVPCFCFCFVWQGIGEEEDITTDPLTE